MLLAPGFGLVLVLEIFKVIQLAGFAVFESGPGHLAQTHKI